MTGYGGASRDAEWMRRVVLSAATGVMVVVDTLTPAPFQDGYLSGVLWKFATDNTTASMGKLEGNNIDLFNFENVRRRINKRAASHTVGQCSNDHYDQCPVDAPSDQRLLCVFGGNAKDEEYGVAPGWRSPAQRNATDLSPLIDKRDSTSRLWKTVYSKRRLVGGQPNVFVSVFIPYWNASAKAQIAAGATIDVEGAGKVVVRVRLDGGGAIEASLGGGDAWGLAPWPPPYHR